MSIHNDHHPSRRAFLGKSAGIVASGMGLPFVLNLGAITKAAAFNAPSNDYKALVCIHLAGGNDYANTVVPYDDASYNLYSTIRGSGLALAKSDLQSTKLIPLSAPKDSMESTTREFALHPSMTEMCKLFNDGKMAIQLNVGPLIKPLTRSEYDSNTAVKPRPPRLFSHNDQTSTWLSASPEGATIGWGGNMGDVAIDNAVNTDSAFTCITVAGNSVFVSGDKAIAYQVSRTAGAVKIKAAKMTSTSGGYITSSVKNAMYKLLTEAGTHRLENEHIAVTKRSMDTETKVSSALAKTLTLNKAFPAESLADQLKMVARLIHGRVELGVRRQVYYVTLGGFDTHAGLIDSHKALLAKLDAAVSAFYQATVTMGISDQVTTFTTSDFGRSLTPNNSGSDHGWGNHHFIIGGAVKGKNFYGVAPPVNASNGTGWPKVYTPQELWHVGKGNLLPSTSVSQYAATLAKWFGVSDAELPSVIPYINNFGVPAGRTDYPWDMGFLA